MVPRQIIAQILDGSKVHWAQGVALDVYPAGTGEALALPREPSTCGLRWGELQVCPTLPGQAFAF
jgi:hypothetical protein